MCTGFKDELQYMFIMQILRCHANQTTFNALIKHINPSISGYNLYESLR